MKFDVLLIPKFLFAEIDIAVSLLTLGGTAILAPGLGVIVNLWLLETGKLINLENLEALSFFAFSIF